MEIFETLRKSKLAQLVSIEFSVLLLVLIFAFNDTVMSMVTLWMDSETYSHGMFILPLTIVLIYYRLKQFPSLSVDFKLSPLVCLLVVINGLVWVLANLAGINIIAQLAVVAMVPLAVWFRYGFATFWLLKAPLLFLFLAVPVGDFLIPYLQEITAQLSVFLVKLFGIPVFHDGLYISIPNANFLVAEACSGIRFLISAITISIFYALLYMRSYKRRSLMIAAGVLTPIIANGIRVFMIVVIAHLGNVEAATGFDHIVYGWVFFSVVMILLIIFGNMLADGESSSTEIASDSESENNPKINAYTLKPVSYLLFIATLLVGPVLYQLINSERAVALADLQQQSPTEINEINSLFADKDITWAVKFSKPDQIVRLSNPTLNGAESYIVKYHSESADKEMINYSNKLFQEDRWSLDSSQIITLNNSIPAKRLNIVSLGGQKRVVLVTYIVADSVAASSLKVKLNQVIGKLTQTDFGGTAIIMSANLANVSEQELTQAFLELVNKKLGK